MGHENKHLYEFDAFRLDPVERVLARNGERIPLPPKAFDTLLILVQHSGRALTKDELLRTVWPDSFVEENNLTQQISQLRRALGEGAEAQSYIETVPKLGYRFLPEVREIVEGDNVLEVSKRTRTRIVLREEVEEEELSDETVLATVEVDHQAEGIEPQKARAVETEAKQSFAPAARWKRKSVLIGVTLTSLLLAASAMALILVSLARLKAPAHSTANSLVRLTSDSGLTMSPALSPDGRLVAYASDRSGKGNLEIWVQPVSGGAAQRLTDDATDDYAPTFSPDGRMIAYRSERDGGGIYAVSVVGGGSRKVASGGRRPKFSPDGKWMAYWVGTEVGDNTGFFMVPGAGKIYIAPAAGGEPQELRPEFAAAGLPVWAPDSRHILFLGNRDPNLYHEGTIDWWVTSIDGGPVAGTGASAAFRAAGFASASWAPEAWTADGTGVLMSATLADTRNIWRVPISSKDWKVSGAPQRLTFGTSKDFQPSVAGNQMVFASLSENLDVWSLPMDADRAERTGDLERLTNNAFAHGYPAVSPDGTKLAFSLQRAGNRDIWIKDLRTTKETAVSIPPGPSFNPNFSPDGNELLYRVAEKTTSAAYAVSLSAGRTEAICEDCSDYGWSSDKEKLVLVGTSPLGISLLDLGSKRRTALLKHPVYRLWNPRFAPDDRWISFNATAEGRSRIFVAPVQEAGLVAEREWIAVANSGWDDKPRWSPDGKTLYFVSQRDGFRCIWAQRLDTRKRPVGPAVAVFHVHESKRSMSNVGPGDLAISVARDKVVFNMSERTGNLWMANLDASQNTLP